MFQEPRYPESASVQAQHANVEGELLQNVREIDTSNSNSADTPANIEIIEWDKVD